MFRAGLLFLCFIEYDQSSFGGGGRRRAGYLHTLNDDEDDYNNFHVSPEYRQRNSTFVHRIQDFLNSLGI
jgi:hypothetical protein